MKNVGQKIDRSTKAKMQFLSWVRANHPALFNAAENAAMNQSSGNLNGLGETDTGGFWSKISENLAKLGTTYLTLKNQRDAMRINLRRAEAGQPPLDIATTAPVIRTQIDLPPDVMNRLAAEAGGGLNKILLFSGLGFLAYLAVKKMG